MIRSHLADKSRSLDPWALALLFAADRLDHIQNEILPNVRKGTIVISDRYLPSSWVYQTIDCKDLAESIYGGDDDLDEAYEWVFDINKYAILADLTIVLEVPVSVAQERVRKRRGTEEIFDDLEMQTRVFEGYREIVRNFPEKCLLTVDGTRPPQAITDHIRLLCSCVIPKDLERKTP